VENNATADTNEIPKVSMPVKVTKGYVFLETTSMLAKDNRVLYRNFRMLLNSGSQVNFIS